MNEAATAEDQEAGFDDGFKAVSGGTPTGTPEQPPADANEAQAPAEQPVEYAQLTKAEVEELKARAALIEQVRATQDKSFGTFGRTIKDIQDQIGKVTAAPTRDIDQADIDALRADGFESHARALENLRDLKVIRTGGTLTDEDRNELRINLKRELQVEQVADEHPDWQEQVAKPEFSAWKATQSAADQKRLDESWNPGFITKKLTEFKAHIEQKAKAPAPPAAADPTAQRRSRISAAVTPRGSGQTPAPDPDNSFDEGFQAVRRPRR